MGTEARGGVLRAKLAGRHSCVKTGLTAVGGRSVRRESVGERGQRGQRQEECGRSQSGLPDSGGAGLGAFLPCWSCGARAACF